MGGSNQYRAAQNLNQHMCESTFEKGKTHNIINSMCSKNMKFRLRPISAKLSKLPTQAFTAKTRLTQHKPCYIHILHGLQQRHDGV